MITVNGFKKTGAAPRPATERFWEKVRKTARCWNWTGTLAKGYGKFMIVTYPKQRCVRAHRFAYEEVNGPIPEGMDLDHLCRNRKCVRPTHLEAVTRSVNLLRGKRSMGTRCRKHRRPFERRPNGHRFCRVCVNINQRLRYHARKGERP